MKPWDFLLTVLVNNSLWGKLFSSLEWPIIFDESFNVTPVLVFISDFNLLSFELDSFTFNVFYIVIFISILYQNEINYNVLTVSFGKIKESLLLLQ